MQASRKKVYLCAQHRYHHDHEQEELILGIPNMPFGLLPEFLTLRQEEQQFVGAEAKVAVPLRWRNSHVLFGDGEVHRRAFFTLKSK